MDLTHLHLFDELLMEKPCNENPQKLSLPI